MSYFNSDLIFQTSTTSADMNQEELTIIPESVSEETGYGYMLPSMPQDISEHGPKITESEQTEKRTLFLGGLKPCITKEHIWEYFGAYSDVVNVSIKRNPKTGCNKGFAFVNFQDSLVIDKILQETHFLEGRKVECKLSLGSDYNRREQEAASMCKLFVKKLKKTINDAKLNSYFSQFGELKNAYVIYDPENKRSRGYGIIQFANPESADAIMAMNQKHYLDDKEMFLSRFNSADPKKNKPSSTELP